ncbi:ATP synthase F1 subunit epsilon [Pseudoflavonifractor sp. 60]|uniref:ATP synthase F1 subunit epsilon n=1 Tax=Pseudoflavonifractor sp. 60 TaxID=2304576 RepID=UPI00136B7394|nr:ATP synthase F1 subunit epsilon [Pseudoflavonifractor sp. 60]NBI66531.1 ATP synthase F1 subunit epsilon [Pseudoflavonifractor sp. 60]
MDVFQVHILAADRSFYEGPCVSLTISTSDGEMGILAHHSSTIAAVQPGILRWQPPGEEVQVAAVSPGMVKVEHNEVLVLVDSAERPEEIDAVRAQREADEAQEALLQKRSRQEHQIAQATLARALNRLRVKSSMQGRYN